MDKEQKAENASADGENSQNTGAGAGIDSQQTDASGPQGTATEPEAVVEVGEESHLAELRALDAILNDVTDMDLAELGLDEEDAATSMSADKDVHAHLDAGLAELGELEETDSESLADLANLEL